jgi:DNA-binding FadR family transcriptional regulator
MQKEHLHNAIVREVIARVASGTYAPGHRLPAERELCREFDVARGTLRKALLQLRDLGVLRIKPNSGIHVQGLPKNKLSPAILPPDFGDVDLSDVIEARKAIEVAACAQATRRVTARQLGELRGLVEQMAASVDDLPAFLELDMAFHRAVVRASGNPVLRTAFDSIHDYHRFSAVYTSQREGDEREALDYHRRWLAALEKRDAAGGSRILSRHLDAVANGHSHKRHPATTRRAS